MPSPPLINHTPNATPKCRREDDDDRVSRHTPIPSRRLEVEPTLDDDEDDISYRVHKRTRLEDLKDLIRKEVE